MRYAEPHRTFRDYITDYDWAAVLLSRPQFQDRDVLFKPRTALFFCQYLSFLRITTPIILFCAYRINSWVYRGHGHSDHSSLILVRDPWPCLKHGPVLNWFMSYLSSRSFRVQCRNNLSSSRTSSCGVPQGSVLGHILFIMYTTSLSTLSLSQSLNHHLYADDTQLFFSFYPPDLHSSISKLQTTLQEICSWMTANLLTLNSSETEFLLIGLKQQLAKIQNCPLSTTHSARNLGFISDEHCTLPSHALTILQGPKCPWTSRQTLKRAPSFHVIEHCRRESSTFHRSGLHIFLFPTR